MTRTTVLRVAMLILLAAVITAFVAAPTPSATATPVPVVAVQTAQQVPAKRAIIPGGGRGGGLLTPGIMVGNTLYLSGQLGTARRDEGVTGETHAAIDGALRILQAAEMDLSDVVSVTAYLVETSDYQAFNAAYRERFTTDPRPTRTTVIVKDLVNNAKIELTMTAVKTP